MSAHEEPYGLSSELRSIIDELNIFYARDDWSDKAACDRYFALGRVLARHFRSNYGVAGNELPYLGDGATVSLHHGLRHLDAVDQFNEFKRRHGIT